MKSKTCNSCNGTGALDIGPCYQCNERGVITDQRFHYLIQVYWPRMLVKGEIAQPALDRKIASMIAWWDGKAPALSFERLDGNDDLLAI